MPDPPASSHVPEPGPKGLVDPRAIHPGPDVTSGPEARSGPEGTARRDVSSSPGRPEVDVDEGADLVDPRKSLPGPEFEP
jgi:hypothetical protein